ncbi:MAG: bifunctional adenosylcobinamide kinase/adenosylcobinamide-phosphate guanylyltransferase [Anderseniella sp.]
MGKSILIIGGARSGKSTLAESMALALGVPAIYIATAEALDDEMADRISKHQSRRGPEWQTLAEPLDLSRALRESDGQGPRLVDCLTLWLSNLMFAERDWETETQAMLNTVSNQASPVIFVTNEVGGGIVPENKLARQFRDAAGIMNQQVAATCDEVWLCVAGLPVKVKPA